MQLESTITSSDDKIFLEIVQRNSKRINDLITELLDSSRPTEMIYKPSTLQEIVDETIKIASARYIWAYEPSTDLEPTLAGRYFDIVPFIEFADVDNEDGIKGNDTRYLTTSLTFDFGDWSLGATRTDKHRQSTAGADHQDYLNELSLTYKRFIRWPARRIARLVVRAWRARGAAGIGAAAAQAVVRPVRRVRRILRLARYHVGMFARRLRGVSTE